MRVKNYTRDRKGVIGVHAVLEQKTTIHCNYLSLHELAIVSVPKKARRRPVYWTSTPLTRLIDVAYPFFRVQKIAHSRICQSLK
jgi:hypothetical protein